VGQVVRLPGGTVTLQNAVEAFFDQHDLARSTRRVYRASLASLVAGLGPATAVGELSGRVLWPSKLTGWIQSTCRALAVLHRSLSWPHPILRRVVWLKRASWDAAGQDRGGC
jgi:hypothetical protein